MTESQTARFIGQDKTQIHADISSNRPNITRRCQRARHPRISSRECGVLYVLTVATAAFMRSRPPGANNSLVLAGGLFVVELVVFIAIDFVFVVDR